MAKNNLALLGAAGAAALLLMASKKKPSKGDDASLPGGADDRHDALPEGDGSVGEEDLPAESGHVYADLFDSWNSGKHAVMGKLYQVRPGDNLLEVSREVLFGSRKQRVNGIERQMVIDYSIRIDCSPWNQTVYGRGPEQLKPGHYAVENGWSQKGVCFMPIFANNSERLKKGLLPSTGQGKSYPLIWLPMINLDVLDKDQMVTVEGMNHPDDGRGEYSMIDPPPWVIDLGFSGEVDNVTGCELPEGDFRKRLEPF